MHAIRWPAVVLLCAGLGAGMAIAYRVSVSVIEPAALACRAGASTMARVELLFGLKRKDGSEVGEVDWRAFLDAEVTPRFPDGLTVFTSYGQWRNSAGVIIKESTKVLLIWYRAGAGIEADIEAIRAAYKARFGQDSVMRVDGASCVSF